MEMEKLVCVQDFADATNKLFGRNQSEYYNSGAEEELTLRENRNAYLRWLIRPRVLRNVESQNLQTTILGKPVEFPLAVCPMAFQRVAHLDGEIAVARAAEAMGGIFILSTFSTTSIEDIAAAAPSARKWFQLFPQKNSEDSLRLLRRAEAAKFEAIVLTVDAQNIGGRKVNKRNPFHFPSHLRLANFVTSGIGKSNGHDHFGESMKDYVHNNLAQYLTWEFVTFLKNSTNLPIVLKGISTKEDAYLAVEHGVDAIFVSNHGGRQCETNMATIDSLPEVIRAVNGRCEVYVDGGVLRGSDIFKALALGAKMVGVGRPLIWGLAVGGEAGARKVLQILREELESTMALSGVCQIKEIGSNYITKLNKSNL